jgi:hypothetical protein
MPDESRIFPYGITLREDGIIDVFPAVEVRFPLRGEECLSLFFLIDSGAHVSAMPASDAAMFGINPTEGDALFISGISGMPVRGWRHTLPILLMNTSVRIPMVFLDIDDAPRVLGRNGIFDRYTIIFEERKRRTGLLGAGAKTAGRVTKILDSVS